MKKNLIIVTVLILSLVFSSFSGYALSDDEMAGRAPTDVKILATGEYPADFQLGFFPPEDDSELDSYMMIYSASEKEEVMKYLSSLSFEEILSLDSDINRGKHITDLSYADGTYNTFYSGQKDVVSGKTLQEPGEYHFYVLSLSKTGILGIAEADTTHIVKPALEISVIRDGGYELSDYSVKFKNPGDETIDYCLLFYSKRGYSHTKEDVKKITDAEALISEGKALKVPYDSKKETFTQSLETLTKDIDGQSRNHDDFYYVYSLPVDKNGEFLRLFKADSFIIPEGKPDIVKTSIGEGKGHGIIMPAGGATSIYPKSSTYVQEYIDAFMQGFKPTADQKRPRIAVMETSYGAENTMYDYFCNYGDESDVTVLDGHGCDAVYVPLSIENYKNVANEQYFADLVKSCDIVLLLGGDQAMHARCLTDGNGNLTKVGEAVQYVYDIGGTIVGTSAGAGVMSGPTLSSGGGGNYSYETLYWNKTEFIDIAKWCKDQVDPELDSSNLYNAIYFNSTGYINHALGQKLLIDTHFDARGRLGRSAVALRDTDPKGMAMGLDEGTFMRIQDGVGTVGGNGGAYILNAENAQWSKDGYFGVTGLKLSYLTAGDTYNFKTGEVVSSKPAVEEKGDTVTVKDDAMYSYRTTRMISEFVSSTLDEVSAPIKKATNDIFKDGPDFSVTYSKTDDTLTYMGSEKYSKGSAGDNMSDLNKFTAVNLEMSIQRQADPDDALKQGVKNTTIKLKSTLGKGYIKLNWTKSKGYKVDYYQVYKSKKRNSGYGTEPYFKTKQGGLSNWYKNTKELKKGTRYYYKVRGVRNIEGETVYTQYSNKAWRMVK